MSEPLTIIINEPKYFIKEKTILDKFNVNEIIILGNDKEIVDKLEQISCPKRFLNIEELFLLWGLNFKKDIYDTTAKFIKSSLIKTLLGSLADNDKIGTIDPNGTNVPVQLSSTFIKRTIDLWLYHMNLESNFTTKSILDRFIINNKSYNVLDKICKKSFRLVNLNEGCAISIRNKVCKDLVLTKNTKEATSFFINKTDRIGKECILSVKFSIPSLQQNRQNERKGGWNLAVENKNLIGYNSNNLESYFIIYQIGKNYQIYNILEEGYVCVNNGEIKILNEQEKINYIWIFN